MVSASIIILVIVVSIIVVGGGLWFACSKNYISDSNFICGISEIFNSKPTTKVEGAIPAASGEDADRKKLLALVETYCDEEDGEDGGMDSCRESMCGGKQGEAGYLC